MHVRFIALTLWAFFLLPFTAHAQVTSADLPTAEIQRPYLEAIEQSRKILGDLLAEENIPGISVAVMVKGELVWAQGMGYADIEQGVEVNTATKMRIGSVSKPITSAGLGLLVEADLLDLDAPIQTYVPYFPEKDHPITTRQLAGHLGGIRHYRGDEFLSARFYPTVQEGIDIFKDDPLLAAPGTRYSYSSYGWNLVSAAIEGASGEEFLPFMQSRVFDPLQLRNTQAEYMDEITYNRTRYYVKDDEGRIRNAPYVDNSYKWAGGGFISTPIDVVRFGHAMLHGTLLNEQTMDELFTPLKTADGESTGYGLGWGIRENQDGTRRIGHTGGSVGGTTLFTMYEQEDVIICIVSNLSNTNFHGADTKIGALFIEAIP